MPLPLPPGPGPTDSDPTPGAAFDPFGIRAAFGDVSVRVVEWMGTLVLLALGALLVAQGVIRLLDLKQIVREVIAVKP